jgi:hypothetical protein
VRRADRDRTIEDLYKKSPPVAFFIAHGAPNSCGPGCDTWIAGVGRIDDEAPAHLRRVLEQAGKRKLPIYFQSPGGNMREAMEIGRMLRSRGLVAGVARTLPQGCWPAQPFDACSKAMQEKPTEPAVLVETGASCLSACPFALIGASTRLIEPTTQIGVHEGLAYFKRTNGITGRRLELALEKLESKWDREYSRYIAEMGIDKGLFTVVKQTPWAKMHYLTRAELIDFGIDRREGVLGGWKVGMLDEASIDAVYTTLPMQAKTASAALIAQPKAMTLALSCDYRSGAGYLLSMLRPIASPAARFDLDFFVISASAANISLGASSSFLTSSHDQLLDVRQTRVWPVLRDALLEAPVINISTKAPKPDGTTQPAASSANAGANYKITNIGATEVLKAIEARCERK